MSVIKSKPTQVTVIEHGALPTWLADAPLMQWVKVLDSEPSKSSAAPNPMPPGIGGWSTVWNAWGGGTMRQKSAHIIRHGGGHGDYGGNEIYAFDLSSNSPKWTRIWGPTPNSLITQETDVYGDGSPPSAHTYYYLQYDEFNDRLLRVKGGQYISSGTNNKFRSWNWETREWNPENFHPDLPIRNSYPDPGTCMHPGTGDIYVWDEWKRAIWRRSTNTWDTKIWESTPYYRRASANCVDTKRNVIWCLGGGGSSPGTVMKWKLADQNLELIAVTSPLTLDLTEQCCGSVYDPINDCVWFVGGYDSVLRKFDPNTKTVTTATTTGLAPPKTAPSLPGTTAGYVHSKFHYSSLLRALVVQHTFDCPVYVIRTAI